MKQQKTMYQIILDASGSMSSCERETMDGFNEQVTYLRSLEEKFPEQEIEVSLTTFNEKVQRVYQQISPKELPKLHAENYRPHGTTALLDAIGITVQQLENAREQSEKQLPTTVVVLILTDGEENASRLFKFNDVSETIKRLEATEKWTFSFLGADLDIRKMSEQLSIKERNSFSFNKERMREDLWHRVNHSMDSYLMKKRSGESLDDLFDVEKNK